MCADFTLGEVRGEAWANYHETERRDAAAVSRFQGGPGRPDWALADFAASGRAVQAALARDPGVPLVAQGATWCLSPLLGTGGTLLDTAGAQGCLAVTSAMCAEAGTHRLVLVSGGTTLRTLCDWLDAHGLSLRTSGSHDGPSLAGASATGTHGSALGYGPVQNHIRGVHLVTGPDRSAWVGPSQGFALAPAVLAELDPGIEALADDALFGAAAVHLGGLGFVNAVLIEVVDRFRLELVRKKSVLPPGWLDRLASGDWRAVATHLGRPVDPYYYEVDLNPFDPFGSEAFHTMMVHDDSEALFDDGPFPAGLTILEKALAAARGEAFVESLEPPPLPPGFDLPALYSAYFQEMPDAAGVRKRGTWASLLETHNRQLAQLYCAAFAIPRDAVPAAVDAVWNAVRDMPRHFLISLRFVTRAAGTLSFARWPETCVLNIDGAGPAMDPTDTATASAARVRAAFDAAGIPYGIHWGKLGGLTAAKVAADYGEAVGSWRAARDRLLPPEMRQVFVNDALVEWGVA